MAASRSRPSPDLPGRVRQRLAAHLEPGQHLTVAFSGGLDSTVLLHLLARLAPEFGVSLRAAHVDHGLQSAAQTWGEHCAAVAAKLGIRFDCLRVEVRQDSAEGLEAAARAARHGALRTLGGDWLVLAHHRGDQAETLLHRLTRGAGVAGAAAMREADRRGAAPGLLRPLLDEPRAGLEAWARAERLDWIEDPTNAETVYSRNYLRHQVLAPLNSRFPGAEAALARAASHFAEAAEMLDALAAIDLASVMRGERASRTALCILPEARIANLLRFRLNQRGYPAPDAAQLHEAIRQLHDAASPWRARFHGWALCTQDDDVWLEPAELPPPGIEMTWQGEAELDWGVARLHMCKDRPGDTLQLRRRNGGERLRPDLKRPARDLKTLARDHGIPPWWRELLPVVWENGAPIAWGPVFDARGGQPPYRLELPPRRF